ncbi:histidine phosphatase family protein [Mycolicibacterium sp.]|jgi:broad specificity phosphatase PhoE|uniref:histidine phosphatase family protein n=1 Tax=Mycolicibacterium sp. TaxID=2320850 RepID=UPI0028A90FE0|nr:histidine phosphatase family protein [Mycolicibacterium sp.]
MYVSRARRVSSALAMLMSVLLVVAGCGGQAKPDVRDITLTLMRHAESEANAADVASTVLPGPGLTPAGREQADELAKSLAGNDYDGVYASEMLRTQEAAEPLAEMLGTQVTVLPGLNEIGAGWFEGFAMKDTSGTFLLGPQAWLKGDRRFGIPGSVNGDQFNNAYSDAVQKIYDSGQDNPIAFSSGLAIMVWTLMNARNGKPSLLTDHPLPNNRSVVVRGNPVTGWTLVEWDGIKDFAFDAAA